MMHRHSPTARPGSLLIKGASYPCDTPRHAAPRRATPLIWPALTPPQLVLRSFPAAPATPAARALLIRVGGERVATPLRCWASHAVPRGPSRSLAALAIPRLGNGAMVWCLFFFAALRSGPYATVKSSPLPLYHVTHYSHSTTPPPKKTKQKTVYGASQPRNRGSIAFERHFETFS